MEESLIPSLSGGVVGSRFVTQDEVEAAKARREEQWKAAYARLGQEPPPQHREEVYDGRSLAEKLAANRIAKQEEWEEKTKLANQFRALEEDEIMFLDSIREKQEEEERVRKERDGEELKQFKEAVAARANSSNPPPTLIGQSSKPSTNATSKLPLVPAKKDTKKLLKGVIVKKKTKAAPSVKPLRNSTPTTTSGTKDGITTVAKKRDAEQESDDKTEAASNPKRRRISES